MFSHVMIGSNDIARSKKFYDALFGAVGGEPAVEDARGRLIYTHNGGRFLVTKPIDGAPATHANGGTIGFTMSGPDQAKAWHDAGVANGGASIETHLVSVRAVPVKRIWLTFAIPTAISCARYTGWPGCERQLIVIPSGPFARAALMRSLSSGTIAATLTAAPSVSASRGLERRDLKSLP